MSLILGNHALFHIMKITQLFFFLIYATKTSKENKVFCKKEYFIKLWMLILRKIYT